MTSKQGQPPQHQPAQPGREGEMRPKPESVKPGYRGCGKLAGKVAVVTGGDSGIGRAVSVAFAMEGADVVIGYLNEHEDAAETVRMVEREGRGALAVPGDVGDEAACGELIRKTVEQFGRVDVLVNNAGEQHARKDILDISPQQLERTFRINVFAMFHLVSAALPHMPKDGCIINTASVTAYTGHPVLLDYSATKGAIVAFTRSLSQNLADRGIRVNAVAPGPIWTPLIPATFEPEQVENFGTAKPMGRAGEPSEVAPGYVFLASEDASYITGQVLHPNGGTIVNG